jgi:hypothetical protein
MLRLIGLLILCFILSTSIVLAQETSTCPGSLPPRLVVGELGLVTPGDANNVRSAASSSAELIAQIPAGDTFIILEGPVCSDGYTWWKVDHKGLEGWTVEGTADSYWLEPVMASASDHTPAEDYAVLSTEPLDVFEFIGDRGDLLSTGRLQRIEISPDGLWIALVRTDSVWVYSTEDLEAESGLLYANEEDVHDVAFSVDGQQIAVASGQHPEPVGHVWLWDTETFELQALIDTTSEVTGVDFSTDGEQLAIVGEQLVLWSLEDQQQSRLISQNGLLSVDFSPMAPYLIHKSSNFFAELWNVDRAEDLATFAFTEPVTGDSIPVPYFSGGIFSPDGMTIIGTDGKDLVFYSGLTGAVQAATSKTDMTEQERDRFSLCGLAFDSEGDWVISGGDKLRLWDATFNSPTVLRDELTDGDNPGGCAVGFSPDGSQMAWGNDIETELWDFESRTQVATVRGQFTGFTQQGEIITYDHALAYIRDADGEHVATLKG